MKNGEHECSVGDWFTQLSERIGHCFEPAAVVHHKEIPLETVLELSVEDESSCLLVAKKLLLKMKPHLSSNGVEDHYDL